MTDDSITIRLTKDEALVLSDWLYRLQNNRELARCVDPKPVWYPLDTIAGSLESCLVAIFEPDYDEQDAAAGARLTAELNPDDL